MKARIRSGVDVLPEPRVGSAAVDRLDIGSEVIIETSVNVDGKKWLKLRLASGGAGYVPADCETTEIKEVTVRTGKFEARQAPSDDAPLLQTYLPNAKLDVLEAVSAGGKSWAMVRDAAGNIGYIANLKVDEPMGCGEVIGRIFGWAIAFVLALAAAALFRQCS